MLADGERLALEILAVAGVGALLAMLANTELYPMVLGTEVIALVYMAGTGALGAGGQSKVFADFLRKYFP
jgi:hypothetical protein